MSVTKSYSLAFFASVAAFGASAVATACLTQHVLHQSGIDASLSLPWPEGVLTQHIGGAQAPRLHSGHACGGLRGRHPDALLPRDCANDRLALTCARGPNSAVSGSPTSGWVSILSRGEGSRAAQ